MHEKNSKINRGPALPRRSFGMTVFTRSPRCFVHHSYVSAVIVQTSEVSFGAPNVFMQF